MDDSMSRIIKNLHLQTIKIYIIVIFVDNNSRISASQYQKLIKLKVPQNLEDPKTLKEKKKKTGCRIYPNWASKPVCG